MFLFEGGTMKKANRLSLSLGFLGVSMIGAAIFLQYRSFQIEKENSVIYEKVTMKDLSSGTVEKVSQKENENNNIVEEKVENPSEVLLNPSDPEATFRYKACARILDTLET